VQKTSSRIIASSIDSGTRAIKTKTFSLEQAFPLARPFALLEDATGLSPWSLTLATTQEAYLEMKDATGLSVESHARHYRRKPT